MLEEKEFNKNISGKSGIIADGNVTFGDVSGQLAIGENIKQMQYIEKNDIETLRKNLLAFQQGIANLDLSSEDQSIVSGDISAAIKEAKKDKPTLSRIKDKFKSVVINVNEAGKTIKDISELYEPAKKIATILGIGLTFF
jgi:hypothetical protein